MPTKPTLPPDVLRRLDQEAEEKAKRIAPRPRNEPVVMGMMGAFITAVCVLLFGLVAGLRIERYETSMAITIIIGFAVPYAWAEYAQRRHYRVLAEEFRYLQDAWLRQEEQSIKRRDELRQFFKE